MGDRYPNQRQAQHGEQRENGHHRRPQHRCAETQHPENQAAECSLDKGDKDVALDRRTNGCRNLCENLRPLVWVAASHA